jgi:hypothetical protein
MTLLSSLHPHFTYFTYYGHGRSRTCKEVVWLDLMISSSFHLACLPAGTRLAF